MTRIISCILILLFAAPAFAYIEVPHTLGRVLNEASNVLVLKVEKIDKERNLIIYRKVMDLKGKHPTDVIKHNIGKAGFEPREWQFTMASLDIGKTAIFFHNNGAGEICVDNYWYQAYPGGEWWNMSHGEPYLLRTFAGKADKLIPLVQAALAGQEVLVPCMVDGDKEAIKSRTAKIQRLKASLKIMDYDQKRDFAGWGGNEEFRRITNMPGFSMIGNLSRTDPRAGGIAPADFDGDGKTDLCLYGEEKVVLVKSAGTTMEEVPLPFSGGARAASWADYNNDKKPDLLLATPLGPKLLTNEGAGKFKDDSAQLPVEPYYNVTAAAFIDADVDGKPDILLANGFLGLRLYRNALGPKRTNVPTMTDWTFIGPFSNSRAQGFATAYPPESEIDLKKTYTGRGQSTVEWKPGQFPDGQVNSLALFNPQHNIQSVVYLYREFNYPAETDVPISLGSGDTIDLWHNGQRLLHENVTRPAAPDQHQLTLKMKPGKNTLLLKIVQVQNDFAFYFNITANAPLVQRSFEDISDRFGLGLNGLASTIKGDCLSIADVNNDGRPDFLYSAGPGLLAINVPAGFIELKESNLSFKPGRISPLFADFDADKKIDLFIPQPDGARLYKGSGNGRFTDVTASSPDLAKLKDPLSAAAFADFDNNGTLDLLIASTTAPNRYFKNKNGLFTDASAEIGLSNRVFNSRAIVAFDMNNDNLLDLALNNESQDPVILVSAPTRTSK